MFPPAGVFKFLLYFFKKKSRESCGQRPLVRPEEGQGSRGQRPLAPPAEGNALWRGQKDSQQHNDSQQSERQTACPVQITLVLQILSRFPAHSVQP